jgi:hypothetical protein
MATPKRRSGSAAPRKRRHAVPATDESSRASAFPLLRLQLPLGIVTLLLTESRADRYRNSRDREKKFACHWALRRR